MANKSSNTEAEHRIKQKKKKNLSDEYIYGSQNGSVELHKLFNYKIGDEKLGLIIAKLIEENKEVNKRLDNAKKVISDLNSKIENIESRLKTYGLK
jgi:hypothetical protein